MATSIDPEWRRDAPARLAAPVRVGRSVPVALKIAGFAIVFRLFSALLAILTNIDFPDDSAGAVPQSRGQRALYPLLMRAVGRALDRRAADLYIGGLVVSWTAFVLAMIAIYNLARLDLPPRRAERAAILTAIFPFAFLFGADSPEAVFLAATLACFCFFRTRRWIVGGLCGALATATRANGILMWPALAWIAWRGMGTGERARGEGWRAILGLLLVGAGIGSYSLYVYQLRGNPFEWAAAIQRWGCHPGCSPFTAFFHLGRALVTHPYAFLAGEGRAPYDSLNGLAALVSVVSVPFIWLRFGAGYGLFMTANLWLPLSSGQVEAMGRYSAVMFPLFIWLAGLRPRATFIPTAILFAMLYTLCAALFARIPPLS